MIPAETLAFDAGFGSIKLFGKRGGLLLQSAVAVNGTTSLGKLVGLKSARRPLAHPERARLVLRRVKGRINLAGPCRISISIG